jgi:putative mRNA 3-end processing factor
VTETATSDWIYPTEKGLFVKPGGFYIDPVRPVENAVISHGHADHARPGNTAVWATPQTIGIMQVRYQQATGQILHAVDYGSEHSFEIGDVRIFFAPAGHLLGSAQVVLEFQGRRLVYSGDYKRAADPTCLPFEVVPCDIFITEATFGLPIFHHPDPQAEVQRLLDSLRLQPERTHVVGVYALGKAQRLISIVRSLGYTLPIYCHGALKSLCDFYQAEGIELGDLLPATVARKKELKGALVLGPPSAIRETWSRRLHHPVVAYASGWMTVRQRVKQRNAELPLRISDHADWPDLLRTIGATGCREVWVTHGQEDALVYECRRRGLKALPLSLVGFSEESDT